MLFKLFNHCLKRYISLTKPKLHFLHVGETGGTSIIESGIDTPKLKNQQYFRVLDKLSWKYNVHAIPHWRVPSTFQNGDNLAFFVRHPLSRLESIFYYEKHHENSDYKIEQEAEISALFEHFAYFEDWFLAIENFHHPNHREGIQLLQKVKHFQRDYSFYFKDKDNIRKHQNRIIFIGEQEYFDSDLLRLLKIIGVDSKQNLIGHRNKSAKPKHKNQRKIQEHQMRALFPQEFEIYETLLQLKREIIYR